MGLISRVSSRTYRNFFQKKKHGYRSARSKRRRKERISSQLGKIYGQSNSCEVSRGREVTGILKGCDTLMNLVLDQTTEFKNELDDPYKKSGDERNLGLVVCRGTSINMVSPKDGMEQISNPFIRQ